MLLFMMDRMLSTLLLFCLFLCSSGYYQQPQAVQFTTAPRDTVVCQGCTLNLTCSVLRQPTSAGETFVPLPELEWIFENGTRINDALHEVQIQTRDSLTHRTSELIITDARAHHGGVYRCRALDGNNADNCSRPSVQCVPVATISRPARIQIVESSDESEVVSSCSDVVLLACGSKLLEGDSVERPTLTWKRNGEVLSVDSVVSDFEEFRLSGGNLVINRRSSNSVLGVYECLASFSSSAAEGQNVTVAVYNVTARHTRVTEDTLRVTSSAVRVVEGGSVELVCEASLRGDGVCLSYNVTWVTNGSRLVGEGGRDTLTADSEKSLDMDGHVLRISQVSNTSVYCCLVHTGGTVVEECTTVYIVRENAQAIDAETVFLKEEESTEIDCLPSYPGPHNLAWYRNAQLIENFTSSTLTVTGEWSSNVSMSGGVYQCFSSDGWTVEELKLTRILPYGWTNPPGLSSLNEIPHPSPQPRTETTYLLNFDPPLLTGGLAGLQYNIIASSAFGDTVVQTDTNSAVLYLDARLNFWIEVGVIGRTDDNSSRPISEISVRVYSNAEITGHCKRKALYPPSPSLNCEQGLVNLSWTSNSDNVALFDGEVNRLEIEYVNGSCTHTNGSIDEYHQELVSGPHVFYDNALHVGTRCQFAMASAKQAPLDCGNDCFCYNSHLVLYSDVMECNVEGSVQFANSTLQVFENDSSIEVCIRVKGYGFTVNISTEDEQNSALYEVYVDSYQGSLDKIICTNISNVMDDNVVESDTYLTVHLSSVDSLVRVDHPATAVVQVIDDDYATVRFLNSSYPVRDDQRSTEVCIRIDAQLEINASVTVTSEDASAQANVNYRPVNETVLFTTESDPIRCFNVYIISDVISVSNKEFRLSLSTSSRRLRVGTATTVLILNHRSAIVVIISCVLSGTVLLLCVPLLAAASVYCFMRRRRLKNWRISQNDNEPVDWSVEPAVLISSDNRFYQSGLPTETSDYDCKTLLDYLGQSQTELEISLPLQILSTEHDHSDSDCPQTVKQTKECPHGKCHTHCRYNVSVESGVVLDSDPGVNVRKSSDGSSHLSHGSSHIHSYIGVGDVCACSECRLQRERLYATKLGHGTPSSTSISGGVKADETLQSSSAVISASGKTEENVQTIINTVDDRHIGPPAGDRDQGTPDHELHLCTRELSSSDNMSAGKVCSTEIEAQIHG